MGDFVGRLYPLVSNPPHPMGMRRRPATVVGRKKAAFPLKFAANMVKQL